VNRRGFLRGLLALPFAPAALKLIGKLPGPPGRWASGNYNDIIAATIESRSRQIADNISQNNVLLAALRKSAARRAALTPEQRLAEDRDNRRRRWREEARYAFDRGNTVRTDSRAPSGFAAWRRTG
jgi:hypothetical protein